MQKLWSFFTDNKKIHAYLFKPDEIEKAFREVIAPMYAHAYGIDLTKELKDPQKREEFLRAIAFHNKFSLLNHELLHPAVWPNSKQDEEKTDLALYEGIKSAMPQLQAKDLVQKVDNVRNLVWDHGIDLHQYHQITTGTTYKRNLEAVLAASGHHVNGTAVTQFPEGVIPIFDVVSTAGMNMAQVTSPLYHLTRLFYAGLFCADTETREKIYEHFVKQIKGLKDLNGSNFSEQKAVSVIKNAIIGAVSELNGQQLRAKGISKVQFESEVNGMFKDIGNASYTPHQRHVVDTLASVLIDTDTRYDAVRGFIKPLAPYISTQHPEDRHEHSDDEEEGGGGASSALENLLNQLPKEEANELLQNIANGEAKTPKDAKLQAQALDDYYKRNSKEVALRSPRPEVTTIDLGKTKEWQLTRSETVTSAELRGYNVDALTTFQQTTGLPVLVQLDTDNWRINYYAEKELPLKSYTFQSTGIELPRNVVFVVDTSSSMLNGGGLLQSTGSILTSMGLGSGGFAGTGNKYDALMRVIYGLMKTLDKAGTQYNSPVNVATIAYSSSTQAKGPENLHDAYSKHDSPVKVNILAPDFGSTTLDALVLQSVEKQLPPGKTAWLVFSDGDLQGFTTPVFKQLGHLAGKKDNSVAYFQLYDSGGSFGSFMKQQAATMPNVVHREIKDMNEITKTAMSVMVTYAK